MGTITPRGRDWVAVVLAAGIATAVNFITFGVLWDAVVNPGTAGISENATQILIAAFGGITGILGSYIGFRAGAEQRAATENANQVSDSVTTPVRDVPDRPMPGYADGPVVPNTREAEKPPPSEL